MWLGWLIWFARKDTRNAADRRADFLTLFNDTSAESLDEDTEFASAARLAVRSELQRPDSAQFEELQVRKCVDGRTRAAGTASFASLNDSIVRADFLVEFDDDAHAELLDLKSDFDPITLKNLPNRETPWDGKNIPYASPSQVIRLRQAMPWYLTLKIGFILIVLCIIALAIFY